jgi:hypothetical protein
MFKFEHRRQPLLSPRAYLRRQAAAAAVALAVALFSLAVGMLGYHGFEGLPWVDAFVNAAMLLGGMWPVNELHTTAGKLFAGLYAMYCGVVFLLMAGVLFAPLFHRILHRFHLETAETEEATERRQTTDDGR